ncbi:glycosyltransferase family 2 protein [uncultured Roseibium sp.]|uniref:glycosyltransferase family 2 protein n=1 Tax=uncultured Roseibium sp. TaxID=1936171 RepID=UPI003216CC00
MTAPLFTIILAVHRPPLLLPFAIESALRQTVQDFELFIVCDGAPDETVKLAETYAAGDARITVYPFPKGQRHGEAHRDTALKDARSIYVAHLADDDIWLPNHLSELELLLKTCDFGNLLHADVHPDGRINVHTGSLGDTATRDRMIRERWNFFGPSSAGYRLDAYRALPVGWSPAPEDVWTDLHMWRKFLSRDGLTSDTRYSVQCIKLPDSIRQKMTLAERLEETKSLVEKYASVRAQQEFQTVCFSLILDAERDRVTGQIQRELHATKKSARKLFKELSRQKKVNALRNEDIRVLKKELKKVGKLEAKVQKANDLKKAKALQLAAKTAELKSMRASMSWRLTAPFRTIADLFGSRVS